MGIVSCIGNDLDTVQRALREGRSGVREVPEYVEYGLRSQVAGVPALADEPAVDRKWRRFMGDATRRAIDDARLDPRQLAHPRAGIAVGSGVGSPYEHIQAIDTLRQRGLSKVPPYVVPRVMGNTAAASLSTMLGVQGVSYSLVSACASSAHGIGHAAELIRWGKQDLMLAGGAEELRWTSTALFDAMGALSTGFNDAHASRPYDATRDGFVIAGGAGILVLESLDHALQRGAPIVAELVGYGAGSDGADMVSPAPEGAARVMRLALDDAGLSPSQVDYINTHATSTRAGDLAELAAIRAVFGEADGRLPAISSTKGLTGHPIAAAGAHEAIYTLLMMRHGFMAACAHLDEPDAACAGLPLVRSISE